MARQSHIPVLLTETVAAVALRDGDVLMDGTFGRGGYAEAFLHAAKCRVIGIDRDPDAIAHGHEMAKRYDGRLTLVEGRFSEMDHLVDRLVDAVALDLGVSSPQLDEAERGFSFRADGPLDMRMSRQGTTAAEIVNGASETELARILRDYGEERFAKRVARTIVSARQKDPIATTGQLATIVRGAVPASKDGIDPATRSFQGLRIAVNDELGELKRGLAAAERVLAPGGRLAIVSFHSLEDRQVKQFLAMRSGRGPSPSRHMPAPANDRAPTFRLINRKPIEPGTDELTANPRARSARLRAAIRTDAPTWAGEAA
ncbi:MAG: 16S rRNA (cytosine(1402)-N(4))-methyltransferase RsmH [Pseudomonadota bacterium]